jgi:hypothetical protein
MYSDEDKYAEEYDDEKYDSENEEHNDDGRAELIVSNIYKCNLFLFCVYIYTTFFFINPYCFFVMPRTVSRQQRLCRLFHEPRGSTSHLQDGIRASATRAPYRGNGVALNIPL